MAIQNYPLFQLLASLGESLEDAAITSQVKFALLNEKSTRGLRIAVKTRNGVVRLTGAANSEAEKIRVTQLAMDVWGTSAVLNDLVVKD